jgi:hypothetical protein
MFRSFKPMSMITMPALAVCMMSSCVDAGDAHRPTYLKASNTDRRDWFGVGLAWSGDDLVVGASREASTATGIDGDQDDDSAPDSGAVYVFRRSESADPEWAQKTYIKASNAGAGDRFGYSVAPAGDLMAIGAFGESSAARGLDGDQSDDSAPASGAVYVFQRDGDDWQQGAYIKASNSEAGDLFGFSVALWGDTLAVGAPLEDGSATGVEGDQAACCASDSGAVYVFQRVGEEWQQEAYIKSSNTDIGHNFGYAVSLYQDTLVVGSPNFDNAVYTFERSGSSWQEEFRLRGTYADVADRFGCSVALWGGEVLAVGASNDDGGVAYVFQRTLTGWRADARVKGSHTGYSDDFGTSVALDGRLLVVGAPGEAINARGVDGDPRDRSLTESGAAYAFWRGDTTWDQQAYIKASNAGVADIFGASVAIRDGVVAVGARGEASAATGIDGKQSDNTAGDSGAVYIYDGL